MLARGARRDCYWSFQNVFVLDLGHFNIQIQRDRGHKLMLFMFQNKDKDLLGIYQYGCDPILRVIAN